MPPYPMRVNIAKLMIEVGQPAAAAIVLERLLLEDDTNTEVWFLIAAAYRDSKRPATARQYLATLQDVRCPAGCTVHRCLLVDCALAMSADTEPCD